MDRRVNEQTTEVSTGHVLEGILGRLRQRKGTVLRCEVLRGPQPVWLSGFGHSPKGHRFRSQSGHMSGVQVLRTERSQLMFLSLSFSPSFPFYKIKNRNKQFFKK